MEKIAKRLIFALLFGTYSMYGFADEPNKKPALAAKAENIMDWKEPFVAYTNVFRSEQADIWKKVAAKAMQKNQFLNAAQALEKAAKAKGNDSSLYYEASRTYALAGYSKESSAMIKAALSLDPNNIIYLKAYATLANWVNTPDVAYDANQKILKQNTNDRSSIIALGQYYGDKANYKASQALYQGYLSKNPNDQEIILAYARSKMWDDDYTAGQKLLADYQSKFGTDDNYLIEKARLLSFTNQPKEALVLVKPLLKRYPDNQDLIKIKNYATSKINTPYPTAALRTETKTAATPTGTQPINNTPPLNPLLVSAREETKQKKYQKASETYQKYLNKNPKDNTVFLEYIRMQSISGNYNAASKNLNLYEKKFSRDNGYFTEKARFLALSNQSKKAVALIDVLLKKHPNDASLKEIRDYAVKYPELKNNPARKKSDLKGPPPLQSAQAFEKAAIFSCNAQLYLKASQAYSAANKPEEAFKMIEYAVQLEPQNLQYLKNRAEVANWLKKPEMAQDSYERMLAISPKDPDAMLGIARSYSAKNDLYDAVCAYAHYTNLYPMNKAAWIEYAYAYSWLGNNRDAVKILACYCKLFGPTIEYLKAKARILASAERPTPALAIVRHLLPKEPSNSDLNGSKVIALYYNNQPMEMFCALATLKSLNPTSKETKDIADFVTTPYRSNVALDVYRSRDSDSVDIIHGILTEQLFITPLTQLLATQREEHLSADIPSGLAPANGGNGLNISSAMIGMSQRINPKLIVGGTMGEAHVASPGGQNLFLDPDIGYAPSSQNAFIYYITANIKPTDNILINLLESRDYYDVSARAVSLGVKQELSQVQFNWEPCFQRYLAVQASYGDYSDTNSMWYISAAPKIGIIRSDKFNVNLGGFVSWNSFAKKLRHGYYDPELYQYFAATSDVYWKQSTNVGYSLSIAGGIQKDETFTKYEFGGDLSFKGYFGIYKDWMLVLSATASNRGRAIGTNVLKNNGSYQIYSIDATLTKRF